MHFIKLIAYASPLLILIFLILRQNLNANHTLVLFFIIAVTISTSLVYALKITATINHPLPNMNFMQAHILLHIAPAAYIFAFLFLRISPVANIFFLGLMILFFWTGRRTWQTLHQAFESKSYYLFFRGNTSILIVSPIILGLDTFYPSISGGQAFSRLLIIYFTIHFSLVGIVVQTIKKDILTRQLRTVQFI